MPRGMPWYFARRDAAWLDNVPRSTTEIKLNLTPTIYYARINNKSDTAIGPGDLTSIIRYVLALFSASFARARARELPSCKWRAVNLLTQSNLDQTKVNWLWLKNRFIIDILSANVTFDRYLYYYFIRMLSCGFLFASVKHIIIYFEFFPSNFYISSKEKGRKRKYETYINSYKIFFL